MGAPRLDGSGAIGVSRWSLRRKTRFVPRIISGRCSLPPRMLGRFMLASRDRRRRPGAIEAIQFQRWTRRWFKPQLQRHLRIVALGQRGAFYLANRAFGPRHERLTM